MIERHCWSGNGKGGKSKKDPEAGWHVKKIVVVTESFSVHAGVDGSGFIHRQRETLGSVCDSQERDSLLLGDETALYTDAAYSSQ